MASMIVLKYCSYGFKKKTHYNILNLGKNFKIKISKIKTCTNTKNVLDNSVDFS